MRLTSRHWCWLAVLVAANGSCKEEYLEEKKEAAREALEAANGGIAGAVLVPAGRR